MVFQLVGGVGEVNLLFNDTADIVIIDAASPVGGLELKSDYVGFI